MPRTFSRAELKEVGPLAVAVRVPGSELEDEGGVWLQLGEGVLLQVQGNLVVSRRRDRVVEELTLKTHIELYTHTSSCG